MRNLAKKERLLDCVKDLHKDTLDILQMDITDQRSILDARDRVREKRVNILGMTRVMTYRNSVISCVCGCVRETEEQMSLIFLHQQQFLYMCTAYRMSCALDFCLSVVFMLAVCNAGVGLMGPLEAQSLATMRQILEVNLLGTISTIQAFLPGMKAQGHGRILVTGSIGGLQGLPFNEVYCASKFAVEGACESLAILLQHFNIHVSLIECGPVNTDFLDNLQRAEPGDSSLQQVDAHTRSLYDTYLQHCGMVFQNAAQDTEDIVKVFLDAIQSTNPAFRYYTNNALIPLSSPKISALDGSQYIRNMSKIIFSTNGKGEQK
ncbi:estradiol 17-beta-dehydrogenase 1 isoform X2 [Oncorhynchus kisutch]|nr:estradiol 17-beta-dehydrogenase 1 isoform X2 [Oncorhynchus kisutch]